jgi:hypothetical protein
MLDGEPGRDQQPVRRPGVFFSWRTGQGRFALSRPPAGAAEAKIEALGRLGSDEDRVQAPADQVGVP